MFKFKCKICGKQLGTFDVRAVGNDILCKECAFRDGSELIKLKRKVIFLGILAIIATTIFSTGLYYFPKEIMGGIVAYPGKELLLSAKTKYNFLAGAVYADGQGKFIVVASNSELFKTVTTLTVVSDDKRIRDNTLVIGKGTVLYPRKPGEIISSIAIPPYNIDHPIYISGYLLMPCAVAVRSSNGFYYDVQEVQSEPVTITILPTQQLSYPQRFLFGACGFISFLSWIAFTAYFFEYRKGLAIHNSAH